MRQGSVDERDQATLRVIVLARFDPGEFAQPRLRAVSRHHQPRTQASSAGELHAG